VKALADFIVYKERALQHFQYVECNIQAIKDTCWLQKYLKEFPQGDISKVAVDSLRPDEYAYLDTQMEDLEEIQDPENRQLEVKHQGQKK
jgi:hypothetical protein